MTTAKTRILVVEDDEDTLELIGEQLDELDVRLLAATNGEEAILRTGEGPPDLVIMDYMMPRLDGPETTRYFKARFGDRFVPIMILTAKGDPGSVAEGIRMGADEYTTKPYEAAVLRARITRLLALKAAEDALAGGLAGGAERVAAVRVEMARDFADRGLYALARRYLERNASLLPDHTPTLDLLERIGGRD